MCNDYIWWLYMKVEQWCCCSNLLINCYRCFLITDTSSFHVENLYSRAFEVVKLLCSTLYWNKQRKVFSCFKWINMDVRSSRELSSGVIIWSLSLSLNYKGNHLLFSMCIFCCVFLFVFVSFVKQQPNDVVTK